MYLVWLNLKKVIHIYEILGYIISLLGVNFVGKIVFTSGPSRCPMLFRFFFMLDAYISWYYYNSFFYFPFYVELNKHLVV